MKRTMILLAMMAAILVGVSACSPEEAAPEPLPTFTIAPADTAAPGPNTLAEPTTTPYPEDPALWNMEGKEIAYDENTGMTTYSLESWQSEKAIELVTTVFNTLYGENTTLVPPEEVEQYFDTSAPGWLGEGGDHGGMLAEYETNLQIGKYHRVKYPMVPGNEHIYTNWRAWAIQPGADSADLADYLDQFTIVVAFRVEQSPLLVFDLETDELIIENTYFGPILHAWHLQYSNGSWRIAHIITDNLSVYIGTATPSGE